MQQIVRRDTIQIFSEQKNSEDDMTTTWRIGIDWNRNGVICWDALPGDPLNIFPQPLRYTQLDWRTDVATNVARVAAKSDYGIYALETITDTGVNNGLIMGQDNALAVNDIPVDVSTAYSLSARVRGISGYGGVNFRVRVKDQAGNTLVTSSAFTLTADWQMQSVTFATGGSATHILVEIVKDNNAANVTFQTTGFMLVIGSTMPGYNTGHAISRYDNITSSVMDAEWFLGIRTPYQLDANDSMLQLRLSNADQRFSPEYASSPLYSKVAPLRPAALQSWDGATRRTHWSGWLESIKPAPNQYGERTLDITCAGAMLFFEDVTTSLSLQENKRTNELVESLLNEVRLPSPLTQITLLDQTGYCELGVNTMLADTTIAHDLQQGKSTLAFAADNWVRRNQNENSPEPDTFNVYRAIKDVVAAERGRFFFNRAGAALFWNRHEFLLNDTSLATFDNDMTGLSYQFAERGDFANRVRVSCHPRAISPDSNEILWQLDKPVTIAPGKEREIGAAYRDDSENRIGGRNVYLDEYTFSEGVADVSLSEIGANRAKLRLINQGTVNAVLESCVVRGQKITDFGQMDAERKDFVSIAHYGERKLEMNIPSVDDIDDAENIAAFELMRRKDPAGRVQTMTLRSHGVAGGNQHAQQVARTIGERITVTETQTAHSDDYFIIGEKHHLSAGGTLFETTWFLESAVQGNWFMLDNDLLDGSAVLLF
jgi:hypothetical protein